MYCIFTGQDGTLKNQQNDTSHTTTISHHPYILCHFVNYALCLLVACIVESIGVGSAGCGVHVDVRIMSPMGRVQHKLGSELCCGWLQLHVANFVQSLFSSIFLLALLAVSDRRWAREPGY